jgi:hypothetical protein
MEKPLLVTKLVSNRAYQKFLKENLEISMIDAYSKLFTIYPQASVNQLNKIFKFELDVYIKGN